MADLRNVDCVIVAVAQLIQPAAPEDVAAEAKEMLGESAISKRQILSRLKSLEINGLVWSRLDKKVLVTPKGSLFSQSSIPAKDRDKFRLLLLNKSRYKWSRMDT